MYVEDSSSPPPTIYISSRSLHPPNTLLQSILSVIRYYESHSLHPSPCCVGLSDILQLAHYITFNSIAFLMQCHRFFYLKQSDLIYLMLDMGLSELYVETNYIVFYLSFFNVYNNSFTVIVLLLSLLL